MKRMVMRQMVMRSPQTIEQTAAALNISPHTIRRWIADRRISHIRLGRSIRVPAEEIQRLLDRGTVR